MTEVDWAVYDWGSLPLKGDFCRIVNILINSPITKVLILSNIIDIYMKYVLNVSL